MLVALLLASAFIVHADAFDEFRVKPEQVFKFADKPTVTRDGDQTTIAFASKGYCDVTVAIEDGDGRIVRHLASGVLGPNAPAPFQKNSLRQSIVWDGKNYRGDYVRGKCVVRVSLGLKPRYEKTLHWSPHRRTNTIQRGALTVMAAAPDGVYLADQAGTATRIMQFDHDGNYVRTIYPFPAGKLAEVDGIMWHESPQTGLRYPLRHGMAQDTLLTSGFLGKPHWPSGRGVSSGCSAIAVAPGKLYVLSHKLNELSLAGPARLGGPELSLTTYVPRIHEWPGGDVACRPQSAVLSPDGKFLYLAGYFWIRSWEQGGFNCVMRLRLDGSSKPELFVGTTKTDGGKTMPNGAAEPGRFLVAASVDVDKAGRVYVADHGNGRIQVFDAAGKHLKDIPITRPAIVRVHPKTGELWVVSCGVPYRFASYVSEGKGAKPIQPSLARLGPFDNPKPIASWKLPVGIGCGETYACPTTFDFTGEAPVVWLAPAGSDASWVAPDWKAHHVKLYTIKDDKLELKRDFADDALRQVAYLMDLRKGRVKVFCNEADGSLYIGYGRDGVAKSFFRTIRVDPQTGRHSNFDLPWDSEDLAFDLDGNAYLRTENMIARYDPGTWREIPFDYGIERKGVGFGYEVGQEGKAGNVVSGVDVPSVKSGSYWHMGGMSISARGDIAVTCYNMARPVDRKTEADVALKPGQKYRPKIFPGRNALWAVHIFDRHGKILYEDALPGGSQLAGLGIDEHDNLYGMMLGPRMIDGKPYFNDVSCTAFKARPQATRVLSGGNEASGVPVPLGLEDVPTTAPDIAAGPLGRAWFEDAEWLYGGVGSAAKFLGRDGGGCWCDQAQMALDHFARSFLPEPDTYSVAVLDSAGNVILRIGRYGNVDDGMPLDRRLGPPSPRAVGGDEVALFSIRFLATHTDRRLFISDTANGRIISIRLDYHTTELLSLGN